MSDTLFDYLLTSNPLAAPGAFLASDAGKVALSRLPPALLASILPDTNAESLGAKLVPGVIQSNVAGLGQLGTMGYNLGNKLQAAVRGVPYSGDAEPPEFVGEAERHAANALAAAQRLIPTAMTPQTPLQNTLADIVDQAGMSGPIGPLGGARAAVGRAIPTALVPAARSAANLLVPGVMMPKIDAGLRGAGALLSQTVDPHQVTTANDTAPPLPRTEGADTQLDLAGFDNPQLGQTAPTSAPTTQPVSTQTDVPPDLDLSGFGDAVPGATAPNANQTGFKWHDLIVGGLGLALAYELKAPVGAVLGKVFEAKRALQNDNFNRIVLERTGEMPHAPGFDPTNPEPVPKTPGVDTLGVAAKERYIDQDARVHAHILQVLGDTPAARNLKSWFSGIGDKVGAETRLREFMETGDDTTVNKSLPPLNPWLRKIGALTPDQQEALNRAGLATDELDNRGELVRQAFVGGQGGKSIHDYDMRFNMADRTTASLQNDIATATADPVVKALYDEYRNMTAATLRHYNQERGFITDAAAARSQTLRPGHVERMTPEGAPVQAFGEREMVPHGGQNVLDYKIWEAFPQQVAALWRKADLNSRTSEYINTVYAKQLSDPSIPKVFTKVTDLKGEAVDDPTRRIITTMTRAGPETWEVHNANIYNLLERGDNMLMLHSSAAQAFNSLSQATITGPASALSGYVFSFPNLIRTTAQMGTERPEGMAGGPIDKIVQNVTQSMFGKAIGYRGPDPLRLPYVGYNVMANMASVVTKAFADMIERGVNPVVKTLAAVMGEQNVKIMSETANAIYDASHLHQLRGEGIGLQSRGTAPFVRGSEVLGGNKSIIANALDPSKTLRSSPVYEAVPELFKPDAWSFGIHVRNLLRDLNDQIHSGALSAFNRLNRDKPMGVRMYETQQLVGSPGTTGKSAALNSYGRTIPYFGPTLQGNARTMRAWQEAPFATMFGKVMTYAPAIIAERYTAMAGGPEHQNVLDNELTPEQKTDGIFIFHDADPHQYAVVTIPQPDRWIPTVLRNVVRWTMATDDATHDEASRQSLLGGFNQFMSDYISKADAQSLLYAATQNVDPLIQAPALAQAALSLGGINFRPQLHRMIGAAETGQPVLESVFRKAPEPLALPGQDTSHEPHSDSGAVMNTLANSFGQVARLMSDMMNEVPKAHTVPEVFSRLGDVVSHNIRDRNAMFNGMLFTNTAPILARGNIEQQQTMNTLNNLRLMQGIGTGAQYEGMTRKGGLSVPITGESLYPTDPVMQQVFGHATALRNYMERTVLKEITDLDKQKQALKATTLSLDEQRAEGNRLSLAIRDKYAEAAEQIATANRQLTQLVGNPVSLSQKIDWSKGSMQFAPTAQITQTPASQLDLNGF